MSKQRGGRSYLISVNFHHVGHDQCSGLIYWVKHDILSEHKELKRRRDYFSKSNSDQAGYVNVFRCPERDPKSMQ